MNARKDQQPASGSGTSRRERRAAERASRKRVGATSRISGTADRPGLSLPVITGGAIVAGVIAVLLLVALSGGLGGNGVQAVSMPETDPPADELQVGRSLGDPDAPVRIELYEDPQCPACGMFTDEIEPLLVAGPIADGQAFLTYKDLVFLGPESFEAAAALRVAEALDGKFWEFRDVLYHNQAGENEGAFSTERLARMAELVGLERDAFLTELREPEYVAAVEAETAEAQAAGISSTPSLVINGTLSAGVPGWDQLRARIEEAAAAAQEAA